MNAVDTQLTEHTTESEYRVTDTTNRLVPTRSNGIRGHYDRGEGMRDTPPPYYHLPTT